MQYDEDIKELKRLVLRDIIRNYNFYYIYSKADRLGYLRNLFYNTINFNLNNRYAFSITEIDNNYICFTIHFFEKEDIYKINIASKIRKMKYNKLKI